MFIRDLKFPIKSVTRTECIQELLDTCREYDYEPYVCLVATNICDEYITKTNHSYSLELAHTALVITSKYLDTLRYDIRAAADFVENGAVYDLEWDILETLSFSIPRHNY